MIYMKLLLGSVVLARAAASTVCTEQFSDEAKLAYCEGLAAGSGASTACRSTSGTSTLMRSRLASATT